MEDVIIFAGHNENEIKIIKENFTNYEKKVFHFLQEDDKKTIIKDLVSEIKESRNFDSSDIKNLSIPFVYFAYEDRDDVFRFMDKYKKLEIRRSIFSAQTDNNVKWNFEFLFKDLEEDHKFFLQKEEENKNKNN